MSVFWTCGVDKSELDNALQGIAYMRLIKGGGVIDFASEISKPLVNQLDQQLEGLVNKDISLKGISKGKKLKD